MTCNRSTPIIAMALALAALSPLGRGAAIAADDPLRPPAISTRDVPVVPPELAERLRQYQNTRSAAFRGWSPDGKGILIATRFADTAQLHRVYEPGGRREQVTFFNEPVDGGFIPQAKDGALLVTMSRGGNENGQVYFLDRKTGRSQLLTDGESRNLLEVTRHDGLKLIVGSNLRNGRDTDLYIADPRKPGSMQLLMQVDNEHWSAADWSRDGKTLLINRYVSINENYPALFDLATQKKTAIPIPGGGPAAFGALKFTPDGKSAYVATDARGEFQQLARIDLATMNYAWLTDDIHWDVDAIEVEPHTGTVAFTVNEDGAGALYLLENGKRRRIELPLGVVASLEFSPDGKQLGLSLARPDAPADAYTLNLADGKLTRWTYSEVGGLDPDTFIVPRRIQFESFDGRKIPAYSFVPRQASKERRVPVVIDIHGGPEGQYRPLFSGVEQFYLNELGLAVIHPNVRGSAGYGKTYLKLDNADKRDESVRDIGGLLDWIAQQPELDASRVAVSGGSYGGFMVLASLTHFSDRIKAGVDIVGIASFRTFLKNTSAYRQDLRRAEYGDERDPAMQAYFEKIDPLNHTDRIRSSLLVIHGKNDPRVPFSEAEQIADRVRAGGKPVWTVYADNEGRGFARKANRDYMTAVLVLFFRESLGL
ncbi:MAG TPA: prolyl oligopeptidase family serine peptidase [Planctomycetaceae bacterium]|nr:prolyl oligopeptidase family serine peptidase [Planctomycetaceae bacterium]